MQNTQVPNAVALLVFDGRYGLPGRDEIEDEDNYPAHTIVELPYQRELVRNCARSRHMEIRNEIIVELDSQSTWASICAQIVRKAQRIGRPVVITAANDLLMDTGLLKPIEEQLRREGSELVIVSGS